MVRRPSIKPGWGDRGNRRPEDAFSKGSKLLKGPRLEA